jgi:ABC-type sulfate/molybdate transport systems ATPase subunit
VAVVRAGVIQQVGSPEELHDRPVNLFVAGFIGSPTPAPPTCRLRGISWWPAWIPPAAPARARSSSCGSTPQPRLAHGSGKTADTLREFRNG